MFENRFSAIHYNRSIKCIYIQVVLQMLGERPSHLFHNNWLDYNTLMEPSCAFNRLTRRKSLLIIVKSAPHRLQVCDCEGISQITSSFVEP